MDARRAAELAARNAYGRLLAYLAIQSKDLTVAEDALGDAFLAALKTWTERGVPDNPEAWLLVAARHRLIDNARHTKVKTSVINTLKQFSVEGREDPAMEVVFPDERLKLLFICAHPAIAPEIRTPLMLQTVLGLNAAQIASAFLVAPTTMGQRLVRAKTKIRDAGIRFELPEASDLPTRLEAVLEAIYAAYSNGWENITGADPRQKGLTEEAIWLARLCVQLMPEAPETRGLLALMLHCEARRDARRTPEGAYVPLSEQDVTRWSKPLIKEAETELMQAATFKKLGRFQLEAAIQSAHAQRVFSGTVDWAALVLLYEGLIQLSPTLGALIGQAAAIAEVKGTAQGWALLELLPTEAVANYQPYWALKARLLKQLGRKSEAQVAYNHAIGLVEDPAIRQFLLRQSLDS
ncbi:MAG: RNA polymerase subunit sigma-70 [Oscillatoriophycideae cyanobacterium NC_groundwater_1537_Pr4_S-0.65um_50_18]|nr:RNA polymerase subunit sigma-70 [Oscillatoriophycideae cyanobacterium NC_groundwater_1537_Pr4_S-0.65um_50_18]